MDFGISLGTVTATPVQNSSPYSGTHILGLSQSERTQLAAKLALDEIYSGKGCAVFDSYGDLTELILERIPPNRWNDVLLYRPYEGFPVGYNPLYKIPPEKHHLVVNRILNTLLSLYYGGSSVVTSTFNDYVRYSLSAILESDKPTLINLKWFFTPFKNNKHRASIVKALKNEVTKSFWQSDFETLSDRLKQEGTQSTLTKLREFALDRAVRQSLGQHRPSFKMEDIYNKIFLVDLPFSKLGLETTKLLGSLIMSDYYQTALGRSGPSTCIVNGAHHFAPQTQIQMLDTPEECKMAYVFIHKYLAELDRDLQNALIGAAETMVAFRTGIHDSELLAPLMPQCGFTIAELSPGEPLIRTPGTGCRTTVHELGYSIIEEARKQIIKRSQTKYGRDPKVVEDKISKFIRKQN